MLRVHPRQMLLPMQFLALYCRKQNEPQRQSNSVNMQISFLCDDISHCTQVHGWSMGLQKAQICQLLS